TMKFEPGLQKNRPGFPGPLDVPVVPPVPPVPPVPLRKTSGQATTRVKVSAQFGVGSPSDAVSVRVTRPDCVQVRTGFSSVELLSTPELAVHWNDSGCGPLSLSVVAARS